jgi:hypothetical protein
VSWFGKAFGLVFSATAGAMGFMLSGGNPIVAGSIMAGAASFYAGANIKKPHALINSTNAPAPSISTTMEENIPIPRIYGKIKTSGNVLQGGNNNLHVAFSEGEIYAISELRINNVSAADIEPDDDGTEISYNVYYGTTTQEPDDRLDITENILYKQAYRGIAYIAFTFPKTLQVSAGVPSVTATIQGIKCRPLSDLTAGTPAYTRNPAVILADFALNIKKYSVTDIDTASFQALEAYCNAVPTGSILPRYRLDYSFSGGSISDAQNIIESSCLCRLIRSQGVYKVVYECSKSSVFDFTEDNIVQGSLSWERRMRKNIIRVNFINSAEEYRSDTVEVRDDESVALIGDQLFNEQANYITDAEIAQRRAQYWRDKFKYSQTIISLTGFPESAKLEILDVVTVTHGVPGFSSKLFMVLEKNQDEYGRPAFLLEEYNSAIYGDFQASRQETATSTLPNPFAAPDVPEDLALTLDYKLMDDGTYMPQVQCDWTANTSIFTLNYEVWYKLGDPFLMSFKKVDTTSQNTLSFNAPTIADYIVKIRAVNVATSVKSEFTAETTLTVTQRAIEPLDDFDIIANFSDLSQYTIAWQREIISEIKNKYDPSSGSNLVPVVVTYFQYSNNQAIKEFMIRSIIPRTVGTTQYIGDGVASGNTVTDSVNNYVSGSVIGQYLISFETGTTKGGTEHRILGIASDGGSGTVFTVTGTPTTGKYFLVSASDMYR